MKKWSVESLSLAGIAIVLALLSGIAILAWHNLHLSTEASRRVDHSRAALAWLDQFRADLYRAGFSQHRVHMLGSAASLSARDAILAQVRQQLEVAARLADADGARQARLAGLLDLVRQRILTAAPGAPHLGAGAASVDTDEHAMSEANLLIDRLVGAEESVLDNAKRLEARRTGQVQYSFLFLIVTMALAASMVLLRIRRVTLSHKATHARLVHSQRRYQELVETAHEGIWVVDRQGISSFANRRMGQMFGCASAALPGHRLDEFLGENPRTLLDALLAGGPADAPCTHDLCYRRRDGSLGWAIVSARAMADGDGMRAGTLLMLTDITERKAAELELAAIQVGLEVRIKVRTAELLGANEKLQAEIGVRQAAERALAQSEQRLQEIIAMMPVGLFIKDAESRIVLMNAAAESLLGVGFAQLAGTRGGAYFPSEQMARFLASDLAAFSGRELLVREELAWSSALQENRHLRTFKKPIYDGAGAPQSLICICVDLTDRTRAEEALQQSFLQLRQLTEHLETIKEDERKRIALDIHDELGQNLMALKIDIEMLHARAGARHPRLQGKIQAVLDTIDATIRSVRAIINDLHPSTLELGLCPAVEWLLVHFEARTSIPATLTIIGEPAEPPDTRRTAAIFRIVQESLVNVLRHAEASKVEVTLNLGPDQLWVTIADDGIGMAPGAAAKVASFGLRGIRQRIDAFGGELVIDSERGIGTTLSILIPTRARSAAQALLH